MLKIPCYANVTVAGYVDEVSLSPSIGEVYIKNSWRKMEAT
jgi:hypothetical protein